MSEGNSGIVWFLNLYLNLEENSGRGTERFPTTPRAALANSNELQRWHNRTRFSAAYMSDARAN